MMILPPKSLMFIASGLALLSLTAGLLAAEPARADVGVRPVLPGGSDISPEGETPIQMMAEKVVMKVRPATEADNSAVQLNPQAYGLQLTPVWFPAVAEVKANFTMKNPTDGTVSLTAWFPLASALETISWELNPDEIVPRIADFRVTVDEKPVEFTEGELPNPKGADRPPLPWASFPVTFPAGKKTNIHVSYTLPLQQAVKGKALALYYVFQTGAGWAGPIEQAELVVDLPYPASQGTLAGISPGKYMPPYFMSGAQADLPAGAVLEGNQARWTWENFEPGPEDDFAIWLMAPSDWQALEAARSAVQAKPQDGQAWLDLALIYRSLATAGYNRPTVFSSSYREPGLEAFRQAAELLPEHPAPHTGLALLLLSTDKGAASDILDTVQEEVKIAKALEAKNPALAEEAGLSSLLAEDALSMYLYNDATATAEAAFWAGEQASQTAAVEETETPIPATAIAQAPTATPTLAPSDTPKPEPVATQAATPTNILLQPAMFPSGFGLIACIVGAGGLVFLVVVVFLLVRGRPSR
jgi:hypothetical protein